jgi:hypothetical protein
LGDRPAFGDGRQIENGKGNHLKLSGCETLFKWVCAGGISRNKKAALESAAPETVVSRAGV